MCPGRWRCFGLLNGPTMPSMRTTKKSKTTTTPESAKKWGKTLIKAGWSTVPDTILKHQHRLGLTSVDLVIILQVAKHWWEANNLPRPGIASIARSMKLSARHVRRRLKALERAGLVEVRHRYEPGTKSYKASVYSFKGLIKRATAMAAADLDEREHRSRAKKAWAKVV